MSLIEPRLGSARGSAAVLVDYAGFNLRLGEKLHSRGVPVVYYVSPQVWAWKEGRTSILALASAGSVALLSAIARTRDWVEK